MRKAECIIFPDIHGRKFWKSAFIDSCEWDTDTYIFLGDYFDPYLFEGINVPMAIDNFHELTDKASELRADGKTVIMLIGNHDAHYINRIFDKYAGGVRKSYEYAGEIGRLLTGISHNIAYEMTIDRKKVLFSHAGVTMEWYKLHKDIIGDLTADSINRLSMTDDGWRALSEVSFHRHGHDKAGSCIYADVHEHLYPENRVKTPGYDYQVFGHTQQEEHPIINERFAMLDCRKAFALTKDLKLHLLD